MPRSRNVKEFRCADPRCEIDGKARVFSKASLLRQHQLKVHAEKTLKCQFCSKAFSVAYLLRQHESQCNTSVSCGHCGAKFAYQSSLKRHYKTANHGPSSDSSTPPPQSNSKSAAVKSSIDNPQRPTFVTILPLQIVPILIPTPCNSSEARHAAPVSRRERPILPKKVVKKAASVQAARPILPKLTVSTQVSVLDYNPEHKASQAADPTKISVSTSTTVAADESLAPSISTQTGPTNPTCNVAVGIDEVFDDLQKLFEKSTSTNPAELATQRDLANQAQGCTPQDVLHRGTDCLLRATSYHHAETQTQRLHFADTNIQTGYYDDETMTNFLSGPGPGPGPGSISVPSSRREPILVDVGVGSPPFDERFFGHMEVQTTLDEHVQHFGMQTAAVDAIADERQGSVSGAQQLCVSALDGYSQTGGMELSSVETQTIEQFFDSLENA